MVPDGHGALVQEKEETLASKKSLTFSNQLTQQLYNYHANRDRSNLVRTANTSPYKTVAAVSINSGNRNTTVQRQAVPVQLTQNFVGQKKPVLQETQFLKEQTQAVIQQTQNFIGQTQNVGQKPQFSVDEKQNALKQTQNPVQQTQATVQEVPNSAEPTQAVVQQTQNFMGPLQSSEQKPQNSVNDGQAALQQTQNPVQQTQNPVQQTQAAVQQPQNSVNQKQANVQQMPNSVGQAQNSAQETQKVVEQSGALYMQQVGAGLPVNKTHYSSIDKALKFYESIVASAKKLENKDNRGIQAVGMNETEVSYNGNNENEANENICSSDECKTVAKYIKNSMDETVDPCDDFYTFSCGGWKKRNDIPESENEITAFTKLTKKIENATHTLLTAPAQSGESEALDKARKFFYSCMNTSVIEKAGARPALEFIESISGWSMCGDRNWNEKRWNQYDVLKDIQSKYYPAPPFFTVEVTNDHLNSTKHLIKVRKTENSLLRSVFNLSYNITTSSFQTCFGRGGLIDLYMSRC